jgi:mannose/fructose/N-acetylgalactosamine-specific phosphotransferase system component IIB
MELFLRIDDRLLHGQVTHGWTTTLRPELVVVADDHAASDAWEREVYEASGPSDAKVRVLDLATAAHELHHARGASDRVLVLVRGPNELLRLLDAGLDVDAANVGGLHAGEGRVRLEDDLQISPHEARAFEALARRGVTLTYQPLPGHEPRSLPDLGLILDGEAGEG